MPKKRKTRKQKILLDHKRQTVHEVTESVTPPLTIETLHEEQKEQKIVTPGTFSLPITAPKTPASPRLEKIEAITISQNEYDYLGNDLMRTALLTSAIIFAELLIRLFFVH